MKFNFSEVQDMFTDEDLFTVISTPHKLNYAIGPAQFLQFLRSYYAWIQYGAPVGDEVFDRGEGLCHNFGNYLLGRKTPAADSYSPGFARRDTYSKSANICSAIIMRTIDQGSEDIIMAFPFDEVEDEFLKRRVSMTNHECELRIRWVEGFLRANRNIL